MRLRPINMASQPAARRPHVFMELLFCSLRNTSCRQGGMVSGSTNSPTNSVGPGGGALFLTEHREMGKPHV